MCIHIPAAFMVFNNVANEAMRLPDGPAHGFVFLPRLVALAQKLCNFSNFFLILTLTLVSCCPRLVALALHLQELRQWHDKSGT